METNQGNFEYLTTREAVRVLEGWLDRLTRKQFDALVNPMGLRLDDRRIVFPVALSKPGYPGAVEPYLVALSPQGSVQVSTLDPELLGWSWHSDAAPKPKPAPSRLSPLARAIDLIRRPFQK